MAATKLGSPCRVLIRGVPTSWLEGTIVKLEPRQARITTNDPVWRGAVLSSRQTHIRLDKSKQE